MFSVGQKLTLEHFHRYLLVFFDRTNFILSKMNIFFSEI